MALIAGIFVGGRGTRMGGVAKGLLRTERGDNTYVGRLVAILRALSIEPVLVGEHEAYADLGLPIVPDAVKGIGPLGGLIALMEERGPGAVIAIACDMPFLTEALVRKLATFSSERSIVAPKRDGKWEPLFARYDGVRALEAARTNAASGVHSLQALLDPLAEELPLDPDEIRALDDRDV